MESQNPFYPVALVCALERENDALRRRLYISRFSFVFLLLSVLVLLIAVTR